MKICDLPISFISSSGKVRILLTPVGLRLPAAFNQLKELIIALISSLELDVASVAADFINAKGQIKFSFSTCEIPESLDFLLGIRDEFLPHLDFHVVVGAAIAESQSELLACATSFDRVVRQANNTIQPCLFVFSPSSFGGEGLPSCATQIPGDSSQQDISRRVREGFIRCMMEFFISLRTRCDELLLKIDQPRSLIMLASSVFLLGGYDQASEYFERALKHKSEPIAISLALEMFYNKRISLNFDKGLSDRDLPPQLSELLSFDLPPEIITCLSYAFRAKHIYSAIRTCLRLSVRVPNTISRILVLTALNYCKGKSEMEFFKYQELSLLLLKHLGHTRTFMFQTALLCNSMIKIEKFLLKPFVSSLTDGNDWCEQRISPASQLFGSAHVPRSIKNDLMRYLLEFLHTINDPKKQAKLLQLIPSYITIEAEMLFKIGSIEFLPPPSPIRESIGKSSGPFIYNAYEKKNLNKLTCATGDKISFLLTIINPLLVTIAVDIIKLTASNSTSVPVNFSLPPRKPQTIQLVISPVAIGETMITGFTMVIGNITASYSLSAPIQITVIDKLPTLVVRLPYVIQHDVPENSKYSETFQIINPSDVAVDIKGIRFPPPPAVYSSTSLPLDYPPKVIPPLPPSLIPGESKIFTIQLNVDKTFENLSYIIEYGQEKYTRQFNYNQNFSIKPGPHISRMQVVTLDDHDDFMSLSHLLMIIIYNPLDLPIEVSCDSESPIIISSNSYGTFLVQVDRIDVQIGPSTTKCNLSGIDHEHVRKCETNEVKKLNRPLQLAEKHRLWTSIYLKYKIQNQIHLKWKNQNGLEGDLPFSHVDLDDSTLLLLQTPPFTVNFVIKRLYDEIWELSCILQSQNPIDVRCRMTFAIPNGSQNDQIFTAGLDDALINITSEPKVFKTTIHCSSHGALSATTRFYIGEAYFVRKGYFLLSDEL